MALSMFNEERTADARTKSTNMTWRAVVVGAAVPFAMLASAPAVSAAEVETHEVQTVNSEQLPPVPGAPDPTALAKLPDLLTCVTDLLAALPADVPPAPAPPVEGSEQVPPLPLPTPAPGGDAPLPDIAALTTQCQDALAKLPAPPAPAPPVTE
jgi:hypothetical protein